MALGKKKLGKGLGALLGEDTTHLIDNDNNLQKNKNSTFFDIDLSKIIPNPKQPRTIFDKEKLTELATSLKEIGIIEPIIVNKKNDLFEIIAGERRWRAAKLANFKTLPAIIKNNVETKTQLLEMMLVENIQREDLTPIEEANSYKILIDEKKLTHEKLSSTIGKSRSHITNIMRILKLPISTQELINNKKLSFGHAKILINVDEKQQKLIINKILSQAISVRETEKLVQELSNVSRETKIKNKTIKKKPELILLEEKIRNKFKTKVSIIEAKNKSGTISINYLSHEDLDNILNILKIK
jgi:ParB family transcriptional regulator, chromosome partitioning protein